jgi:SPP1 gp7 family putative phage head morphogenesis protein
MADSVNQQLADNYIENAVTLERVSAGSNYAVQRIISRMAKDLKADLIDVDPNGLSYDAWKQGRMQKLFKQFGDTVGQARKDIEDVLGEHLSDLSQHQMQFVLESINKAVGVELASNPITATELNKIVDDIAINGTPLDVFWERFDDKTNNKLQDEIRAGMLKEETDAQLMARITSVAEVSAFDAAALVRTAVNAVANLARLATFEANDDSVKYIMQRSTLDMRTSDICMAYSGAMWTNDENHDPIGDSPEFDDGPPRHVNCRSYLVPVLKSWDEMTDLKTGGRPAKTAESYYTSKLEAEGYNQEEIDRIIKKSRAELQGDTPPDMSYEEWLATKSQQYQISVLGPAKYKLWKAGKMSFRDLVDQSGNPVTVKELLANAE